jgi:hypothetical protein
MASETREARDFSEVELKGFGTLHLTQGETETLRLEGDEETLAQITTEVKNDRLIVDYKRKFLTGWRTKQLDVYVTFKELRKARLSGSGAIRAASVQTFDLALELSGSGKLHIERLTALRLLLDISGSGEATLGGVVEGQRLRVSGSGEYDAAQLACDEADIDISGSGTVVLRVEKQLRVKISGSGKIDYIGAPQIEQRVSGSGKIRQRAAV